MKRMRVAIGLFLTVLQLAAGLATSIHLAYTPHLACFDGDGELVHAVITPIAFSQNGAERRFEADPLPNRPHRHEHCQATWLHRSPLLVSRTHTFVALLRYGSSAIHSACNRPTALSWSPDGKRLAAASLGGPVTVFDETGARLARFDGHEHGALAVAWSPDGRHLASAGQDGRVAIYYQSSAPRLLNAGGSWVDQLAWSPGGEWLASAAGRSLRVWLEDGTLAAEVTGFESTVTSLFWMPGGTELVTSCYGGIQFVEVGRPDWVRRLDWKGSILKALPSPDGRFIATGNQDATVHVWETKTGKDLQMNGFPLKVRELAWSEDGLFLATGGAATVTLWHFAGRGPAGKVPQQLKGHEERVSGIAFSGGGRLVSTAEDQTLRVWRQKLKSWRCDRVKEARVPLLSLALSPDGRYAAASGRDGVVATWALEVDDA